MKTILALVLSCVVGHSAILFDGVDDQITLGNKSSMNITGPITMMMWIKTSTTVNCNLIAAVQGGSPFAGYAMSLNVITPGKFTYYGGVLAFSHVESSGTITNNQWRHIAVSVAAAGAVTNATFYIDGVADVVRSTTFPTSVSTDRFLGSTGLTNFGGTMTGVGIFDRAFTAAEINTIYTSKLATLPVIYKPVCYWPMINVPSGSTCNNQIILDLSLNQNNGVGDDGAGNTGITSVAETILSYP